MTLQRAATAREAIATMHELTTKYGYAPATYDMLTTDSLRTSYLLFTTCHPLTCLLPTCNHQVRPLHPRHHPSTFATTTTIAATTLASTIAAATFATPPACGAYH